METPRGFEKKNQELQAANGFSEALRQWLDRVEDGLFREQCGYGSLNNTIRDADNVYTLAVRLRETIQKMLAM